MERCVKCAAAEMCVTFAVAAEENTRWNFFREIWRHILTARHGSLKGSAQMITCDPLRAGLTITVYYPLSLVCSP